MENREQVVSREEIPLEIKESEEYRFTTKEGSMYCVLFQQSKDDFSFWLTEDMDDNLEGYSSRGSKEEMIEELEENNLSKAVELLKGVK